MVKKFTCWLSIMFMLLIAAAQVAHGQQAAQYSLYHLNKYQLNPAYGGMEKSLSITGVNRAQWANVPGNPSTQSLNGHLPLYLIDGAAGFRFQNDRSGAIRHLTFGLSYNYVVELEFGLLSAGASLGFRQFTLDGELLRSRDGEYMDGLIIHNDPVLPTGAVNSIQPDIALGLYFINEVFEGGISVLNALAPKFDLSTENNALEYQSARSIIAMGEYYLGSIESVDFIPSVMLMTDFKTTQLTLLGNALVAERIFASAGIRGISGNTFDAVILGAGYRLNEHFDVHYAYDIGLSSIGRVSDGSHEIILKYNLNKPVKAGSLPKIIYNPRFLE